MRTRIRTWPLVLVATIASLGAATARQADASAADGVAIERRYCTQFGPFWVRFDPDKAAGVFAIHANGDLGSMVGVLEGDRLTGIWVENDSRGQIRMSFSPDRSTFEAEYNVESEPDEWYRGWLGRLQPEACPAQFDHDGKTYLCR